MPLRTISRKPSGISRRSTTQTLPRARKRSSKKSIRPTRYSQIPASSRNTTKYEQSTTHPTIHKINGGTKQDPIKGTTPASITNNIHRATIAATNLSKAGTTVPSDNSSWMTCIASSTTNRCGNSSSRQNENKCSELSGRWWDRLPGEIQTSISSSTTSKWELNKQKQGEGTKNKCGVSNRESTSSIDAIEIRTTQTQPKKLSSS